HEVRVSGWTFAQAHPCRELLQSAWMRRYYGRDHRVRRDGSIELDGTWAGVQPIAIGLSAALLVVLLLHSVVLCVGGVVFGLYLLVLPTRRRVTFDASARVLRVEHAGPFRERWSLTIPFVEILAIRMKPAGRRGGRSIRTASARTGQGEVYLLSLAEGTRDDALEEGVIALLTGGDAESGAQATAGGGGCGGSAYLPPPGQRSPPLRSGRLPRKSQPLAYAASPGARPRPSSRGSLPGRPP